MSYDWEASDERKARIEACRLKGICSKCEKPINDGDGIYSIGYMHWECYQDIVNLPEHHFSSASVCTGFSHCRANGGELIHLVDNSTDTAKCGHKPKDTAFRMRTRGKWIDATGREVTCRKCKESL
jgi:hypothetical protein